MSPEVAFEVNRAGDHLAYQVTNRSEADLWAFLFVPSIIDGRWSFAQDTAWTREDEGVLVLSKSDTATADGGAFDRVRSGAIRLTPGHTQVGQIHIGDRPKLSAPYSTGRPRSVEPRRVRLEVGWVPHREGIDAAPRHWQGTPFIYAEVDQEEGGQRISSSETTSW